MFEVRELRSLGQFGRIHARLVSSPQGRQFVAFGFDFAAGKHVKQVQVLFSAKQAAVLAGHLRAAAHPQGPLAEGALRQAATNPAASAGVDEGSKRTR